MNWFVNSCNREIAAGEETCEHLHGATHSYLATEERDSFGGLGYYHMCEACANKAQEEEDNRTVVCQDCKSVVLSKDTITWTWYDFYAAQGDIPLVICKSCAKGPKHQERLDRDHMDYQAEFGSDDKDDYQDDYDYDPPDDQDVDRYGSDGHYID